ncbi:MAG: glycine cleavage system aminomethyltransferase GcvT [Gammaproteobacteria bacterium]|nr:glycine cleavage system aminomethyltransferase GcvT [Gammaproteobacteria bacterium]
MTELLTTPLNALHIELGAKMVPFAGYSMPVQYADGIVKEHLHSRDHAGLFDVSHMGQLMLSGKGIDDALEKILPINVKDLKAGRQRYGFFTLENGGILDDLMLTRVDDETFYMVVNSSRKGIDCPHLRKHLAGFEMVEMNDHALIAIQGLQAADALEKLIAGVSEMKFMDSKVFTVDGVGIRVSRSGYTGEDGYEISIPADKAIEFTKKLLAQDNVKPAGLGARDSLRLEAGLCLYGNDIDENTTPIEADLLWAIQKIRKAGGEREGGFIGADVILSQIESGAERKRVGFTVDSKAPVRAHTELFDSEGNKIGEITSGGFGATLNAPVAMGYVDKAHSEVGTKVIAKVRKKEIELTVAKMPLVPQRYKR